MEKADTDKMADYLRTLIGDAEELLRATAGSAGEKVASARARAEQTLRDIRAQLGSIEEQLSDRAQEVDGYVRENPWTAIAVASVLAFVVGMVVSRR